MSDDLARRPDVELVRTGTWPAVSGPWTASAQDLAAAVAATQCPAIRNPVIKLGHVDERFDGEPALGWYENLRLADGGHTLVADQVALPWLTKIQAAAYPSRSVEGFYNHRCQLGHTHPFVLTAVALLGVTRPAIGPLRSIQDMPEWLGVAAGAQPQDPGVPFAVTIHAAAAVHTGAMIALVPSEADAQRLALDGGEPAGQLHCTLMYLGQADQLNDTARAAILAAVAQAVTGQPPAEADAFAASVFNPTSDDRDTALVLSLGGPDVPDLCELVRAAVASATEGALLDLPDQHEPYAPHITLAYTDDLTRVADAAQRTGPLVFNRVRVAFGGATTDIPLIDDPGDEYAPSVPNVLMAVADVGSDRGLRDYWTHGKGAARIRWGQNGDFKRCVRHLRKYVADPEGLCAEYHHEALGAWPGKGHVHASITEGGAVTPTPADIRAAWNAYAPEAKWIVEIAPDGGHVVVIDDSDRTFTRVPVLAADDGVTFGDPEPVTPGYVAASAAQPTVYASRAESRPAETGEMPATDPPAAEPEPTTDPKEDPVSTLSDALRSRLGLPDGADEAAVTTAALAALDAKPQPTEPTPDPQPEPQPDPTPAPQPEPQLVAASALGQQVNLLQEQVKAMSQQLAAANAEKATAVKASVLDAAQRLGKFTPADRPTWESNYDKAPDVTTSVLASISPGTAVPVAASGITGPGEPVEDESRFDALFTRKVAS